jgi:ABC-type siderophore export system fused ATPase/permease subunit
MIASLGLVGFAAGITSMIKNQERAVLIYLPILVGLVIIFLVAAELIYTH